MADLEIAILGASGTSADGSAFWLPARPIANDNEDVSGVGEAPVFQSLGVTSFPAPKDSSGYAECLMAYGVGGRDAVCLGGRDTRSAKIIGKGEPGDTFVHSTGSNQAAQLVLKERKRQAVLTTTTKGGKRIVVMLDGKNEKLQILGFGAMIEINDAGGVTIAEKGGAAIKMANGQINLIGRIVLGGGMANPAACIMLGPVAGSPGGPASVPLQPAMGVFIGL